jgi:hypothetical protein
MGCKDLDGVRVLLANHRWEKRLLRFLEMTGVGKVVDGVDVEETRADEDRRMDPVGSGRRRSAESARLITFLCFPFCPFPF